MSAHTIARRCALAMLLASGSAMPAAAQTPPAGRIEIAIGPTWTGGASMTPLSVTETQAGGTPRTVLTIARDWTSTIGVESRIGVRIAPRLDLEAAGSYARPQLNVTTANDVESASPVTASDQLQEYAVGGAGVWFLRPRGADTRTQPFVTAGLAYARQLHQPGTLAQTGTMFDVGGGVKRVLMTRSGTLTGVGLRADIRARTRSRSLALDDRAHVSPMIGVALFMRF